MGRFGVSLGRRIRKVGKMCPRFQMFWHPASHNQNIIKIWMQHILWSAKMRSKAPAIYRGFFLIIFTLTLLQRPSFLSNNFLNSLHRFFSQNLLIKLINYGTSQCQNFIFNFIFFSIFNFLFGCCFWAWRNSTLNQ